MAKPKHSLSRSFLESFAGDRLAGRSSVYYAYHDRYDYYETSRNKKARNLAKQSTRSQSHKSLILNAHRHIAVPPSLRHTPPCSFFQVGYCLEKTDQTCSKYKAARLAVGNPGGSHTLLRLLRPCLKALNHPSKVTYDAYRPF
jgi:hypothetical protein